jgi:hypothetical protein
MRLRRSPRRYASGILRRLSPRSKALPDADPLQKRAPKAKKAADDKEVKPKKVRQ